MIELYRNNCGSLRGLENSVEPLALQAVFACIEIYRSPKLPLISNSIETMELFIFFY